RQRAERGTGQQRRAAVRGRGDGGGDRAAEEDLGQGIHPRMLACDHAMQPGPAPCIMRGHPFIRIKGYISPRTPPMSKSAYLFTSESVSEGHPDKVADQISDAVLDAILAQDKRARVACETMVKTGVAIVAGEITTTAWVDLEALTRKVILDIGYDSSDVGFDGATCGVLNLIGKQSPDINQGVDR